MTNITVRNISEEVMENIKYFSEIDKRSVNSQILVMLEKAVSMDLYNKEDNKNFISKETQLKLWDEIGGKWEDKRSTKKIIEDIYKKRSLGRKIPSF